MKRTEEKITNNEDKDHYIDNGKTKRKETKIAKNFRFKKGNERKK